MIDCGVGNLFSITCALRKAGLDASIVSSPSELKDVDAVVLPGVGNFNAGSRNLKMLRNKIFSLVDEGVPLLGVCLGMQLLFESSEESKGEGLGLFRGRVVRLPKTVKIPHMGWNTLKILRQCDLLAGVSEDDYFYFVHSYYGNPADAAVVVAETDYGLNFASVVNRGNIYGTQFHPEKSGEPGVAVLRNFVGIVKK
ncbi:imidazole glycerol phosphate synthase subunit HisH [Candidatus Bathyarchaeota archaeon]|nr:MAG: imidazole glycerol phosphate synthase subunit HisH [Candidatus Bathyarchaeota archaeon]